MRKRYIAVLFAVCLILSFSGCDGPYSKKHYARLDAIDIEIESRYSFVGEYGMTIGGKNYSYREKAAEFIQSAGKRSVENQHFGENKVFYICHYRFPDAKSENEITKNSYGIGLFSMDYRTGKCVLIQDLKEVYPVIKYVEPHIIHSITQDRYAVLVYNNMLELRDTDTNTVLFSKEFVQSGVILNYKIFGNHIAFMKGDTICFYEFQTTTYQLKEFTSPQIALSTFFKKSGNVLYAGGIDSVTAESTYHFAVDVLTGEEIPVADLPALLESNTESEQTQTQTQSTIVIDEREFVVEKDDTSIILNENDVEESSIVFDNTFIQEKSNAVYSQILECYSELKLTEFHPKHIKQHGNKIMIGCQGVTTGTMFPVSTPVFLFEYDLYDDSLLYAGYLPSPDYLNRIINL